MSDLRAILIEGLFYLSPDTNKIMSDRGDSVEEHLGPLIDQDVQLAIHFLPPTPPEPDRWGGGCCMWQPAACPAGHHEHPDRILNVSVRGVLGYDPTINRWWVDTFEGNQVTLPFALLDGHHGRVAAATVFDVQAMQEALAEKITPESLEALGVRANNLRDLMERLRVSTEGGK